MKIAIIAAMPQELAAMKHYIKPVEMLTLANINGMKGQVRGHEVLAVQSGIGKVNASITTTLLINLYQPDYIINTGSAAGLDSNMQVGDVVVAKELRYHDVDATAFNYQYGQVPQMPEAYYPKQSLTKLSSFFLPKHALHDGLIVSGDAFIADLDRVLAIKARFPQAKAVDMESGAIAQVCYCYQMPYCIVRSISDFAINKANQPFKAFLGLAAENSALIVDQMAAIL